MKIFGKTIIKKKYGMFALKMNKEHFEIRIQE